MIFKGSGCFQFLEAVFTSTAKKAYVLQNGITTSSSCFIGAEQPCTVVTNFVSEGEPML